MSEVNYIGLSVEQYSRAKEVWCEFRMMDVQWPFVHSLVEPSFLFWRYTVLPDADVRFWLEHLQIPYPADWEVWS